MTENSGYLLPDGHRDFQNRSRQVGLTFGWISVVIALCSLKEKNNIHTPALMWTLPILRLPNRALELTHDDHTHLPSPPSSFKFFLCPPATRNCKVCDDDSCLETTDGQLDQMSRINNSSFYPTNPIVSTSNVNGWIIPSSLLFLPTSIRQHII